MQWIGDFNQKWSASRRTWEHTEAIPLVYPIVTFLTEC